jgi:MarR family transcriptional regulator, organic hydroperoxide resistance regulator
MPHSIEREIQISQPLTSAARELVLNMFRTDQHMTARLQEVLRPADLRLDEYNVLRILRGAGAEGHPRTEIERRMVHEPDRLLALLHKLKSRGLIEGSLRLNITAAGMELLASLDGPFESEIETSIGWIPAEKLRVAIEVMEEIRNGRGA